MTEISQTPRIDEITVPKFLTLDSQFELFYLLLKTKKTNYLFLHKLTNIIAMGLRLPFQLEVVAKMHLKF